MLRNITVRLKHCLALPFQMARTAQEGFGLMNHVWVFAQLNMSTVSTSEHCKETSNRTQCTHLIVLVIERVGYSHISLWYQNPKYATRLSADCWWYLNEHLQMVWSNPEMCGLQTAGAKKILLCHCLWGGQLYLAINYLLSQAKNGVVPTPKVLLKINTEKDTVREI